MLATRSPFLVLQMLTARLSVSSNPGSWSELLMPAPHSHCWRDQGTEGDLPMADTGRVGTGKRRQPNLREGNASTQKNFMHPQQVKLLIATR